MIFLGFGNLKGFGLPWMPVFPPPYGPSGLLRFLRILMPGTMLSGENMFTFSGLPGIRILTFRGIPGLSMVPGRMRRYVKAVPISKEPMISAPSAGPRTFRKIPCVLFTGSPIIERDLWGGFGFEGMPFSPIWCALWWDPCTTWGWEGGIPCGYGISWKKHRHREAAGRTAPPEGLFLWRVGYKGDLWNSPAPE